MDAVTQYCVVVVAVATGLAMFGFDNPVDGLHAYRICPGHAAVPLQTCPFGGLFPVYTAVPLLFNRVNDCSLANSPPLK